MKQTIIILSFILIGCGGDININDTTHTIHIVNPVIEYCERLYPSMLYPSIFERETLITSCLEVCTGSDSCGLPDLSSLPISELPL